MYGFGLSTVTGRRSVVMVGDVLGEVVVVCDGSGRRNTCRMGAVQADYSWRSYVQCSWLVNCVRVAS